jgi:CheY-like chemotaxis protein
VNKLNTIWLVEDNPVDLFINTRVLMQGGFAGTVIQMPSPEDALQALCVSDALPELILLDIRMPEMDGFEFLDQLAALPDDIASKVKVVLLSSSIDPVDYQRAVVNSLVLGFVPKPLTKEKLSALNI